MPQNELIYLDNFRGFTDAVIPLRKVTFFVGENSTGKSSVISALHLLREFSFWLEPEFDSPDQHLGGFADVCSIGSRKCEFSIGSVRTRSDFSGNPTTVVMIATFSNREGLPYASKMSILTPNGLLTVGKDKAPYFKLTECITKPPLRPSDLLELAKIHHQVSATGSQRFSPVPYKGAVPLFHYLTPAERGCVGDKSVNWQSTAFNILMPTEYPAVWLAPIRTKPSRVYDGSKKSFSAEGDHTPYLLKKELLKKGTNFKKMIKNLGRESHLFSDVSIKEFGSQGDPFEVKINLDGVDLGISNVGYGVSQVLPILVEILSRKNNTVFHIQQPEVHLHPRAQSALGDLFYALSTSTNNQFVIETHSDFLIDRFRSAMATNPEILVKEGASVVFFSRKNGANCAHELVLSDSGGYPEDQPTEFREFFIHEEMRNLNIQIGACS